MECSGRYKQRVSNNTAFDNEKNDIIIMIEQGGNNGTLTVNNAANKIAGHRTGTYDDYPTLEFMKIIGMDMKLI